MPSAAAKRAVAYDPTVYPIQDEMGEGSLQRLVSELLRILVERWLRSRGTPLFVGADQFFYWKQFDASESIAPDVYVLPGAPPLGVPLASRGGGSNGAAPKFTARTTWP